MEFKSNDLRNRQSPVGGERCLVNKDLAGVESEQDVNVAASGRRVIKTNTNHFGVLTLEFSDGRTVSVAPNGFRRISDPSRQMDIVTGPNNIGHFKIRSRSQRREIFPSAGCRLLSWDLGSVRGKPDGVLSHDERSITLQATWAKNIRRTFGNDGSLSELILDDGVTSWKETWCPDGTYRFLSMSSQCEYSISADGSTIFTGINRIKIFPDGSEQWKRGDGRTVEKSSALARGILRITNTGERIFEVPPMTVVDFPAGERLCFSEQGLVVSLTDGAFILAPRRTIEGTIITADGATFRDPWNETLHRFLFGRQSLFEHVPLLSDVTRDLLGFGNASFEKVLSQPLSIEQQTRLNAIWEELKATPKIEPFRERPDGRLTFDFSPPNAQGNSVRVIREIPS